MVKHFSLSTNGFILSAVSEEPVAKVEKPDAAITTAADSVLYSSSPPLLVAERVPSIIIQDSFIVEKSSLPPSASPSSSKLNSSTVPVPKARNTMNNKVPVEVDLPAIVPPSRRKDLATVEEMPTMEVYSQPAGVSARPRMSSSQPPPSSFPVGVARPPPVAKPSRPFPPSSTKYFLPLSSDLTIDPIAPPESEIQISPSQIKPIPLNLFDSDSDDEEDSISEDDNRGRLNVTYIPVQSSKARLSTIAEESDESFWEMLENLVIEHDLTTYHTIRTTAIRFSDAPPPKPVAPSDALEEYEELNKADDDWLEAESADVFFSDQTVELSAVEKIDDYLGRVAVSLQTSGHSEETPKNSSPKEFRRSRLFSISTSQTDTEPKSTKIHLDGLDDDSKADTSRGFGGSDHLSSASTIAWDSAPTVRWNSDLAMTSDSAVYVTEEDMRPHDVSSSLSNSSTSSNFKEALIFVYLLSQDAMYTPQPGTTQFLTHKPVRPRVYQGKSNEVEKSFFFFFIQLKYYFLLFGFFHRN